jgi:ATP-dependent helicase HepA
MWEPGDRLTHRFNPDLGPGKVLAIEGRQLLVYFPESDEALRLAANSEALVPLVLPPGSRAILEESGEPVTVEGQLEDGRYVLADGSRVGARELWPLPEEISPFDQIARGKVGSAEDFVNRLDALHLSRLRQADGLGSFLGGRIHLYPHQLHAAERACAADPVRWLLADEVGLGKTVEACLIMNRLIHTGRVERTLVVAPETLTVQWLSELWRKYHQIFVLVDDKRRMDVAREYGESFNPFEVYRQAIVSIENLIDNPQLTAQAVAAGIDLLVVDEAHHLKRPPEHPGNEAYRAVAPIAHLGRHMLLLTATPLEEDAHGFFSLLQLLRPDQLPEASTFEERLEKREPLPPCTTATRRADIGGLPPRIGVPIGIDEKGWEPLRRLEEAVRERQVAGEEARRRQSERLRRAFASTAALEPLLEEDDPAAECLPDAVERDPRMLWLTAQASRWRKQKEKTLVFVADRESLEFLTEAIERRGRVQVGIFHEGLTPERRDIEVAQFRLEDGPALLISTECGGEGRNFEFCRRLVLFDLPWHPGVVEQRIGRLDRIGRTRPTEIVYFRPPAGFGRALATMYERLGIFESPLGGIERELRHLAAEVERVALDAGMEIDPEVFDPVLGEAREAYDRVREAAFHELHRDPYRSEMAEEILARVPEELEPLTEDLVLRAAARFGFEIEEQIGRRSYLIEFGSHALVDHLPGVVAGSRYLGTFDREEAVADESLDFFASGHALVEGVLAELEEGSRGRSAFLQLPAEEGEEPTFGLLALYPEEDGGFRAVAVDQRGQTRPELAERLTRRGLRPERVEVRRWTRQRGWRKGIEKIARGLPEDRRPTAVAAFRLRPRKSGS